MQAAKAAPSSEHWNVALSLAVNVNEALVLVPLAGAPAPIVVCGAVVSTVHVCVAGVVGVAADVDRADLEGVLAVGEAAERAR